MVVQWYLSGFHGSYPLVNIEKDGMLSCLIVKLTTNGLFSIVMFVYQTVCFSVYVERFVQCTVAISRVVRQALCGNLAICSRYGIFTQNNAIQMAQM